MDQTRVGALSAVAAAALLTVACMSGGPPNPGARGRITGHVTRSPTCPGPQHVGQDCTGPVAGATVRTSGSPMATTTTDAGGLFTLTVIVGAPVTLLVDTGTAGVMSCEQPVVRPVAGTTVTQDIACDTGIRRPRRGRFRHSHHPAGPLRPNPRAGGGAHSSSMRYRARTSSKREAAA
jgi:hypothetical protein